MAIVGASLGGGAAAQAAIDARPGEIDRVVLLAHMLVDAPERLRVPALFIVARDDANADGPRLPGIRAQYEKAAGPKELVVLDGAAHAQFLFDTPQGADVLQRILRFLEAAPAAQVNRAAAATLMAIRVESRQCAWERLRSAARASAHPTGVRPLDGPPFFPPGFSGRQACGGRCHAHPVRPPHVRHAEEGRQALAGRDRRR